MSNGMKHLTDAREPITTADIDQAQADARRFIYQATRGLITADAAQLVARLLAIVEYSYGPPSDPVHLMTPDFDIVCGHDGEDPSSGVLAEVTCLVCAGGR